MSTSRKGSALELKAMAALEAHGYLVHRTVRTSYQRAGVWRSNSNDVFGCVDLIALKLAEPVRFVQVSTPNNRAAKRKKLEPVARRSDPESASFEVWSFHGGRKPKGQRFDVQAWNGLEWAACDDELCVAEQKPARAA